MWVVICKELNEKGQFSVVEPCGSIMAITKLGIPHEMKDRLLSYDELRARLSKTKPYHTHTYFIKYCKLLTSKHKNNGKQD